MLIVDSRTGRPADPVLVDRASGRPLQAPDFMLAPGPAATASTRRRLARGSRLLAAEPQPVAEPDREHRHRGPRRRAARHVRWQPMTGRR